MKNTAAHAILLGMSALLVAGCEDGGKPASDRSTTPTPVQAKRWYSQLQVSRGGPLFQANCAACHKADASGTTDWKKLDANGKLPPPPLNGTAHTWHHPLTVLRRTVTNGGIPLGGTMPEFGSRLNPQQIDNILAWVQSHWSDQIYHTWNKRNSMAARRANRG